MAVNLTDFRQQNPQYNQFPDAELLEALWHTKYSNFSYDQFIEAMGNVYGKRKRSAVEILAGGRSPEELQAVNEQFVGSAEGVYLSKQARAELAYDLFELVEKIAPMAGQTKIYDPITRAAIKLEREWRWYDPLLDLGNFAAGALVAPAAMATYPEGAIMGIGHALKTTIQSSPMLPGGTPNPFYSPEAQAEAMKRPFSTYGMTMLLGLGAVRGTRAITDARAMVRAREVATKALAVERERALTEASWAAEEASLAQANAEAAAREGIPGLTLAEIIEAQERVQNEPMPSLEKVREPVQSLPNISNSLKAAKWVGKSGTAEGMEAAKRIRVKAAEEQGKVELREAPAPMMQVADHPNLIAEPPPDVPYDISKVEPPPVPKIKVIDRIETGRARFLDIFNDDFKLSVRRSGERNFRDIEGAQLNRLKAVIESREHPIEETILHKNGDVTLRVGKGEKQRIYKMERLPKAEVKIVNPQATIPPQPIPVKAAAEQSAIGAAEVKGKEPWEMKKAEWRKHIKGSGQNISIESIIGYTPANTFREAGGAIPIVKKGASGLATEIHPNYPKKFYTFRDKNGKLQGVLSVFDDKEGAPLFSIAIHPEYQKQGLATNLFKMAEKDGFDFSKIDLLQNAFTEEGSRFFHKASVKRAHSEGKPVSEEVLAEYPELRQGAGKPEVVEEFKGTEVKGGGEPLYFASPLTMKITDWVDGTKSTLHWWMDELARAAESDFRSPEGKKFVDEALRLTEIRGSNNSKYQQNLYDDGIGKLSNREAVNVTGVIEGRVNAITQRAADFAQKAKGRYAKAYQMIIDNGFKVTEYTRKKLKNGKTVIKTIRRDPREVKNYVTRFVKDDILLELNTDLNKVNANLKDMQKQEKLTKGEKALSSILSSWIMRRDPFLSPYFYEALEMYKSWGMNEAEAYGFFMKRVKEQTLRKGVFEHPRTAPFPMSFYERDIRIIMPKYFDMLARRIAEKQVWGNDGELLHNSKGTGILDVLHQVNPEEGRKASYLADIMNGTTDQSTHWPAPVQKALDIFTEYEVYSKIYAGTAAIPNALQFSISTIPQMSVHRFVRALWKIASDPEFRKFTHERSGMFTLSRALTIFGGLDPRYTRLRIMLDKYMLHHPFNEFNRMQSYLAAATADVWINDLYKFANSKVTPRFYKTFALRKLSQLRIDPKLPLTEELLAQKVFRVTVNSQLLRDIMKDPLHMNDPRFRVIGLFQRFNYRQSRFFLHEILGELRNGNPMPLVRAAILGYLGGEVATYAKNRTMEFMEGLASLATGNGYEFIDRKRYDGKMFDFSNPKLAAYHAINNYAAIATAGLFTQILSTSDPSRIVSGVDVVQTAGKQIGFAATPVLVRELFLRPSEDYDSFMQTWRSKGIREAVRQLPADILRETGTLGRAIVKGTSSEDKNFIYDLKMAIKTNDTPMVDQVLAIAESRGANVPEIIKQAIGQYKREISEAAGREMREM